MYNLLINVESLLDLSDLRLTRIFDMDGKQARQQLEKLLLKGNAELLVIETTKKQSSKPTHYSD